MSDADQTERTSNFYSPSDEYGKKKQELSPEVQAAHARLREVGRLVNARAAKFLADAEERERNVTTVRIVR